MAERIFAIDGVSRLIVAHNEVTVNKSVSAEWPQIGRLIGAAIREHLASGDAAVSDAAWKDMPSADEIRQSVHRVLDREINPSVSECIGLEESGGFHSKNVFERYKTKIENGKSEFLSFLAGISYSNIVGYGASATSTTLIYHYELADKLEYLVDDFY